MIREVKICMATGHYTATVLKELRSGQSRLGISLAVKEVEYETELGNTQTEIAVCSLSGIWEVFGPNAWMTKEINWAR